MNRQWQQLIEELTSSKVLRSPLVIDAFQTIDRADFVPERLRHEAYINAPAPIGHGQTISQPLTVAFMLELLAPEPGNIILDIGAGSGWSTALLAHIATYGGTRGKVLGIEVIPYLCQQAQENVSKYNFIETNSVDIRCMNASGGLPKEAPFHRIIAAASAHEIPDAWKRQLAVGGRIVAPIDNNITELTKTGDTDFTIEEYPGFAFVPFVEK